MPSKLSPPEVGTRFGEWEFLEEIKAGRWLCRCSCGLVKDTNATQVKAGLSKSCGHNRIEALRQSKLKHGLSDSGSRAYAAWRNAKQRCFNPENAKFSRYGSRGITLFKGWVSDFAAFLAYVGEPPGPEYSLGRINNDKGYEPGNVEWQTGKIQANNRSSNRLITYQGKTLTLTQWCDKLNLSSEAVSIRLNKLGWSEEKALTTPVRKFSKPRKTNVGN